MLRIALMIAVVMVLAAFAVRASGEDAPAPAAPTPAFGKAPVQITLADGSRALRVTRLVKAPIADVWNAWASSEGLSKALDRPATVEPRLGGKFEILWVPDAPEGQRGSEGCIVQAWIPERMLAFTWNAPPQFPTARTEHAIVVIEMDEIAPGVVRVRLTHHGFGDGEEWDGVYEYFTAAWPHVMQWVCDSLGGPLNRASEGQQGWVYLITSIYRENFLQTITPEEQQVMADHSAYLRDKTRAGQVVHAGPCTDMIGPGIVIFYAGSEEEARAVMENDPAVQAGIFITELHPLAMSLVRERDRTIP